MPIQSEKAIPASACYGALGLLDALHRAYCYALWRIKVTFAFNARIGVDDVDHITFRDRIGWALGFASAAGNTFVRNLHCHD